MPAVPRCLLVRASLALLLAAAGAAQAEPAYRAHEVLAPEGGPPLRPYAINNTGSVAGNTEDPDNYLLKDSFTLRPRGPYVSFQPFGATYSQAYGINDLGDIVGYAMQPTNDMAYLKPAGQPAIALFPADGSVIGSYAWGVNASRQVVGNFVTADNHHHAFSWKDGVVTQLPSLGGKFDYAGAVNASGVIAGGSRRLSRRAHNHAVKWVNGALVDLGGLGYTDVGGDGTYAINDAGWVAGYCSVANFQIHGCLWHDGVIDDLPPLVAGSWGEVRAINNHKVAVGRAGDPNSLDHAVIWKNGVVSDLNQQVALPAGVVLEVAQSINDKGRILAQGYDRLQDRERHFVLVPVATP